MKQSMRAVFHFTLIGIASVTFATPDDAARLFDDLYGTGIKKVKA